MIFEYIGKDEEFCYFNVLGDVWGFDIKDCEKTNG